MKRFTFNSLSFRLAASAAVVSIVLLIAAGLLLDHLFKVALERNFDARLQAVLDGLLSSVELDENNAPTLQSGIADARFNLPLSGWYWQITPVDDDPERQLKSPSLLEKTLSLPPAAASKRDKSGIAHFDMRDDNGTRLRGMEQRYTLFGGKVPFSFMVVGNFDELSAEVSAFRNSLVLVLGLLGFGLLAALLVQVRFGLRPLRQLRTELAAIREGDIEQLSQTYPSEIAPVATELNLLIKSNSEIVERARTQVGNLAHALKTPLSVLTNEAANSKGRLAAKVREQANVMRDQVNMYLDRARRAARAQSLGATCEVAPVVDAIGRTLQRIHVERGIKIDNRCQPDAVFRGERQDLEEMVGNLMDNAFKWASKTICVEVAQVSEATGDGRHWLEIAIGDDGPGVADESSRQSAMQRGQRLDETKPGSGLGLSIVTETASMYHGALRLDVSRMGGLLAVLRLPAARRGSRTT